MGGCFRASRRVDWLGTTTVGYSGERHSACWAPGPKGWIFTKTWSALKKNYGQFLYPSIIIVANYYSLYVRVLVVHIAKDSNNRPSDLGLKWEPSKDRIFRQQSSKPHSVNAVRELRNKKIVLTKNDMPLLIEQYIVQSLLIIGPTLDRIQSLCSYSWDMKFQSTTFSRCKHNWIT